MTSNPTSTEERRPAEAVPAATAASIEPVDGRFQAMQTQFGGRAVAAVQR